MSSKYVTRQWMCFYSSCLWSAVLRALPHWLLLQFDPWNPLILHAEDTSNSSQRSSLSGGFYFPSACFYSWSGLWKILSPLWESLTRLSHLSGFTVKPRYEWGLCKNKRADWVAALQGFHSFGEDVCTTAFFICYLIDFWIEVTSHMHSTLWELRVELSGCTRRNVYSKYTELCLLPVTHTRCLTVLHCS